MVEHAQGLVGQKGEKPIVAAAREGMSSCWDGSLRSTVPLKDMSSQFRAW